MSNLNRTTGQDSCRSTVQANCRSIHLVDNAIDVLKEVLSLRGSIEAKKLTITDQNNRSLSTKELKLLFISSKSNEHWSGSESFGKMFFMPHCKASGVRYRAIGQARHTFGSHMMTLGIPLKWIADEMGHTSTAMLEKHYGKFMQKDGRKMASEVSKKWRDCFDADNAI